MIEKSEHVSEYVFLERGAACNRVRRPLLFTLNRSPSPSPVPIFDPQTERSKLYLEGEETRAGERGIMAIIVEGLGIAKREFREREGK